jgi:hypothetical protein
MFHFLVFPALVSRSTSTKWCAVISASLNHARPVFVAASLLGALLGASVAGFAHAGGSEEEISITSGSLAHVLGGGSLVMRLNPVIGEECASADRSREEAVRLSAADEASARFSQSSLQWASPQWASPQRAEGTLPVMRPSLQRSGRAEAVAPGASGFDGSRRTDMLPYSRVVMPFLVSGLVGPDPDASESVAGSPSFRPLAGAVVGVRPSFLRPRVPGN